MKVLTQRGLAGVQVEWASIVNENMLPEVPIGGGSITAILADGAQPQRTVKAVPLQFHFHSYSEHTMDGQFVRPSALLHLLSELAMQSCTRQRLALRNMISRA